MYDISQIQKMRKVLGMTQLDLAKYAGVSQSLIAKVESNKIDPAYSKVVKIFQALDSFKVRSNGVAKDIMTKKVIHSAPNDSIKKVIKKMNGYHISQLPIIDGMQIIGRVTEATILKALTEGCDQNTEIREVMDEQGPIVSVNTSINVVSDLLKEYNFVVVEQQGKLKGVIARVDILSRAYK